MEPYQFKGPEPYGICIDYLKVISKRLGFKIKFIPDTIGFSASMRDFMGERKHYDMFSSLKRTLEREGGIFSKEGSDDK